MSAPVAVILGVVAPLQRSVLQHESLVVISPTDTLVPHASSLIVSMQPRVINVTSFVVVEVI